MKLYRGISVRPDELETISTEIRRIGLRPTNNAIWIPETIDPPSRTEQLFDKPDLSTQDTRPGRWVKTRRGSERVLINAFPVVCACGDELGATYYATRHNRSPEKSCPLLIKFNADVTDLHVDGNDFLYNFVFQKGQSMGQRQCALKIFGPALGRYLDRAWKSSDTEDRIALCDLAVQDLGIIEQHHSNRTVINDGVVNVLREMEEAIDLRRSGERDDLKDNQRHQGNDADAPELG